MSSVELTRWTKSKAGGAEADVGECGQKGKTLRAPIFSH